MTTETTTEVRDPRLPSVGGKLKREYKGKTYEVTCLTHSFKYEDVEYKSLSALARHITGAASINGFLWFGLIDRGTAGKKSGPKADADKKTSPAKNARSRTPKKSSGTSGKTSGKAGKKPKAVKAEAAATA